MEDLKADYADLKAQEVRYWLHLSVDSVYWYYTYKRWLLWQFAKAWIDMPTFIIVCAVLLATSLIVFGLYKPWFAAGMSAVGGLLWQYIL